MYWRGPGYAARKRLYRAVCGSGASEFVNGLSTDSDAEPTTRAAASKPARFAILEVSGFSALPTSGFAGRPPASSSNRNWRWYKRFATGKIVRSMDYLSHEEALKAVGLAE